MVMVSAEPARVEDDLVEGRVKCPRCGGMLGRWGHARERPLRVGAGGARIVWLRPRRACCRSCRSTHVLLPDVCLLRRRYAVKVIGAVLLAKARTGAGHREIAELFGLYPDTVRDWLRRFARNAEQIRAHFSRWAVALDSQLAAVRPAGGGFADAVTVIGVAARAVMLRFGPRALWPLIARLSGGGLLAGNTSSLYLPVP